MSEYTRWMSISNIEGLSFIGKDVIAAHTSKYITFHNLSTHTEQIYSAQNEKVGDGVECLIGHKNLHIFAFAEKINNPRIFLINYPDFKIMTTTVKDNTISQYSRLELMEAEQVVALSNIPICKITVWCWRTGRKLISSDIGIQCMDHIIRYSVGQASFCHSWNFKLCMWDIILTYKGCMLLAKPLYKENRKFVDFTWSNEGALYACDENGNIYSLMSDGLYMNAIKEWTCTDDVINNQMMIVYYKNGLVINNHTIKHIKKNNKEWFINWAFDPEYSIIKIITSFSPDSLLCATDQGDILKLIPENDSVVCQQILHWDKNIIHFDFINPNSIYIITLNRQNVLCLRSSNSGKMVAKVLIVDEVECLTSHPLLPLVAISRGSNDKYGISLIDVDSKIFNLSSLCLTNCIINKIIWSNDGNNILVSTQASFFYLKMEERNTLEVLIFISTDYNLLNSWISIIDGNAFAMGFIDLVGAPKYELKCYNLNDGQVCELSYDFEFPYGNIMCYNGGDIILAHSDETQCIDVIKMNYDEGNIHLNKINSISLDKKIDGMHIACNSTTIASWCDESVTVFEIFPSISIVCELSPCHRYSKGVLCAKLNSQNNSIASLTREHNFVVHNIQNIPGIHFETQKIIYDDRYKMKTEVFKAIVQQSSETWIDNMKKKNESDGDLKWAEFRKDILQRYEVFQHELKNLLDENFSAPESHRLPLISFKMDDEAQELKQKNAIQQCEIEKLRIEDQITSQDKVTEWIKVSCWDPVKIIGTELHSIFTTKFVENYSLSINKEKVAKEYPMDDLKQLENIKDKFLLRSWNSLLQEKEKILIFTDGEDISTIPNNEYEEINEYDIVDPYAEELDESTAKQFITPEPIICSQILIQTYLQLSWCAERTNKTTTNLQSFFNQKFDEMMKLKQKELHFAKERSQRLCAIILELNTLRRLKGDDESIHVRLEDPQWVQKEVPSKLLTVEADEISASPYVSPSQTVSETSHINVVNPFYEETLITVMDGTLKKLWYEEIKKDIPKPQCMIEKSSDDLTETDLIEIEEWKEKVQKRKSERDKYGSMLKKEFDKVSKTFNEKIHMFNEKHKDLYKLKLKVESSIAQEELRLMLLRVNYLDRIEAFEKHKELEKELLGVEMEQERVYSELSEINNQLSECQAAREVLVARNRMLDKNFKTNFTDVSPLIIDLCFKLFQKRPKWQTKSSMTVGVLLEMAQACLTKDTPPFLHIDCIEYLKGVDQLDLVSNMPPVMDEIVWMNMCKLRRVKIDNEIKVRAVRVEITDVEVAYAAWQKRNSLLRTFHQKLRTDLSNHRIFMEMQNKNSILQFVIKSGLVDVKTTGHLNDFEGAILIRKEEIETIKDQIKKAKEIKIKAERSMVGFKKHILSKEWEHATLKMKIKHLESELYYFERIKVTKEVQKYIQDKAFQKYDKDDIETKLQATKMIFDRQLLSQIQQVEELEINVSPYVSPSQTVSETSHINVVNPFYEETLITVMDGTLKKLWYEEIKKDIPKPQCMMKLGSINAQILHLDSLTDQLKEDISKKRQLKDFTYSEEQQQNIAKRMQTLVWRNRLVSEVQKQHSVIILLQTDLELQRLKTYPTLSVFQSNS